MTQTAPAPRSFGAHREELWSRLAQAGEQPRGPRRTLPEARPGPGLGPIVDAAAALSTMLDLYATRGARHATLSGATTTGQADALLRVLGPLPVGAEAATATVTVEVAETVTGLHLKARSTEPAAVYESVEPVTAEPRLNRWTLDPPPQPAPTSGTTTLFATGGFGLREGAFVLLRDATGTPVGSRMVGDVRETTAVDGSPVVAVSWSGGDSTAWAHPVVQTPTQRMPVLSYTTSGGSTYLQLATLQPGLATGTPVVLETATGPRLRTITSVTHPTITLGTVDVPATRVCVAGSITAAALHHGLVDGARLARLRPATVGLGDLRTGVPVAGLADPPSTLDAQGGHVGPLVLVDAEGTAVELSGTVIFDVAARRALVRVDPLPAGRAVPPPLRTPVQVHGNVVRMAEGESVEEVLGVGDPHHGRQKLRLTQHPLVFDAPDEGRPDRRCSLVVSVAGRRWSRVDSRLDLAADATAYTLEQDEEGTVTVAFTRALPAGAQVTAQYRAGATGSAAPSGSVNQPLGAPSAVRAVRQPMGGTAGLPLADYAQRADQLRRAALMLDRAVPASDFAARAETHSGVARAEAGLRWLSDQELAGVVITFVGTATEGDVLADLTAVAEPGLPVSAVRATSVPARLVVAVAGDGTRDDAELREEATAVLVGDHGLLAPRRVPVGRALPLEHLHAAVLSVPGVERVLQVSLTTPYGPRTGSALLAHGLDPGGGPTSHLSLTAPDSCVVVVETNGGR